MPQENREPKKDVRSSNMEYGKKTLQRLDLRIQCPASGLKVESKAERADSSRAWRKSIGSPLLGALLLTGVGFRAQIHCPAREITYA